MYVPRVGEVVRAFHPRMFGVVKTGRVVKVADPKRSKWVRIDFGELLGGEKVVPLEHVVGPGE